jgi:Na+-translocating ferredoxin:NAD+ oxidoreductase subunit B
MSDLVERILDCLPQTQCRRCGFEGCRPYAEMIAKGTPHNQCPPGGARVISELSTLLRRPELPLNPEHGQEGPRFIARIRERDCIGCTKCLQACPVDAIVGAPKHLHTVIASACSGCELCVPTCPVDCIEWIPSAIQPESLPTVDRIALEQQHRRDHERRLARQDHESTPPPNGLSQEVLACLDELLA